MNAAGILIAKFGGARQLAEILGAPYTTVHTWVRTGVIPTRRQPSILSAARELNLDITAEDLIMAPAA